MDTLLMIAEVGMGFVGFTMVVVALRMTTGGGLTPLQSLLARFYMETGFLAIGLAALPAALVSVFGDTLMVWRVSTYACLAVVAFYVPMYIRRRLRTKEAFPLTSLLVLVGYGIAIVLLILTATELFWLPSLAVPLSFVCWVFGSSALIFVMMLGQFMEEGSPAEGRAEQPGANSARPLVPEG